MLTTQQNKLRKELESNETMLSEQTKQQHNELDSRSIHLYVNAIRSCMQRFERIQNELQKLYRDQVYEEKSLLEHYKQFRPSELDLHNQIKLAIQRWELIYNQLLEMQLNEKRINEERDAKYDQLLNELELKKLDNKSRQHRVSLKSTLNESTSPRLANQQQHQTHQIHSSYHHQPTYAPSNEHHSSYTPSNEHHLIHSTYAPTKSYSSSMSSSSYTSSSNQNKTNYSSYSSLKSTGTNPNQNVIFSSSSSNGNLGKTYNLKTQQPEESSLIFRRPEVSSLKNISCLNKWFEDLGREDAEWIARNQLKNEKFFEELVRLQKAQWDKLYVYIVYTNLV